MHEDRHAIHDTLPVLLQRREIRGRRYFILHIKEITTNAAAFSKTAPESCWGM